MYLLFISQDLQETNGYKSKESEKHRVSRVRALESPQINHPLPKLETFSLDADPTNCRS